MENNKICYDNACLSQVICRIDFQNDLSEEKIQDLLLSGIISKYYPIREVDQLEKTEEISLQAKPNQNANISEKSDSFIRRSFTENNGINKCVITKKYLYLNYKKYDKYESLKDRMSSIIRQLNNIDSSITVNRFGLRYINMFNNENIKIQKSFFTDEINGFVGYGGFKNQNLSRAMGKIETIKDGLRMVMNFGEYNSNYPGIINNKDFVLDYDVSTSDLYAIKAIDDSLLEKAHNMIQEAFEQCITDKLRNKLGQHNG